MALHTREARHALQIGTGAAASGSYLNQDAVVEAAVRAGAQAIHPGYGFLSENADFANKVSAAGLTFIGPPSSAMRAMGSKDSAKECMAAANVPLLPGYHGADQSWQVLKSEAEACGLAEGKPVLLKAVLGGGGKGMRIVRTVDALRDAVESAQRESTSSFGDARLLIERYLPRARHIEVQVFCDMHGNAVHLFERDCSVQRRHQKVLEEAPGPGVSPELRAQLGAAAVKAAQAVGYEGAGTVEFIADAEEPAAFYFMEMNTRLQVEHPVSELVSGVDLVEWQLRVAAGEPLPLSQSQVDAALAGHAIEARVYAERPRAGFLPGSGTLRHLRLPHSSGESYACASVRASAAGALTRTDAGVAEHDVVSVHYDPMLAKVIVRDVDRRAACARLRRALKEWETVGVPTNVEFVRAVLEHDSFLDGDVHTAFIEQHKAALLPPLSPPPPSLIVVAAAQWAQHHAHALAQRLPPHSPFGASAFSLSVTAVDDEGDALAPPRALTLTRARPSAHARDAAAPVSSWAWSDGTDGGTVSLSEWAQGDAAFRAEVDGVSLRGNVAVLHAETDETADRVHVFTRIGNAVAEVRGAAQLAALSAAATATAVAGGAQPPLHSPMPGKLIKLLVKPGQQVSAGEALVVLEAMKMEHTLNAESGATVAEVHSREGDLVGHKALLVSFAKTE